MSNHSTQRVSAPLPPKKEITRKKEEEPTLHQPVEDHLADDALDQTADGADVSGDDSDGSDSSVDSSSEDDPQASRSRAWASRQSSQAESVMAAANTRLRQYLASKKPNEAAVGRAFIALEDRAAKLDSNYRNPAIRGVTLMHAVADLHCRITNIEQRKHKRSKPASKKASSGKKPASKKAKKEEDRASATAPASPEKKEKDEEEQTAAAVEALMTDA